MITPLFNQPQLDKACSRRDKGTDQVLSKDDAGSVLSQSKEVWYQEQIQALQEQVRDLQSQVARFERLYDNDQQAVIEGITEREQIEEILKIQQLAIDESFDAIVVTDAQQADMPLVYVNAAFERITGYTATDVIGRNCRFLQGTDIEQPPLDILRTAIRAGDACRVILRNYRKDGTLFWNELQISPVQDSKGQITHFIGVQRDITERIQAEEQLEQTLKDLNELNRRLTREGWTDYLETQSLPVSGYIYNLNDPKPIQAFDPTRFAELTLNQDQKASFTQSLTIQGEPIGSLSVMEPHHSEENAQNIIEVVARNLSTHLENLRLTAQTEEALALAEGLYQASRRINEAEEPQDLLATIVDSGPLHIINRAVLYAYEYNELDEVTAATVISNWHNGRGPTPIPIGQRRPWHTFSGQALLLNREPTFLSDVQSDDRLDIGKEKTLLDEQVQAAVVLPLWAGERQLGTAIFEIDKQHYFTENEMTAYLALSRQLAMALDRHRLIEQTQEALKLTQRLYQAGRRLNVATQDLQEALAAVLEVAPLPAVNRAILLIFEENSAGERSWATVAANWYRGSGPKPTEIGTRIPWSRYNIFDIFISSDILFFNDILHDKQIDPATRDYLRTRRIGATAALPLYIGERHVGIVLLQSTEPYEFTHQEIEPFATLSSQLAVTIDRQRLLIQAQQRAERERRVRTITDKIRWATSRDNILNIACEEIAQMLGTSESRAYLGTRTQLLNQVDSQSNHDH